MTKTKQYEISVQWVRGSGWFGWLGLRREDGSVGDEFITGYHENKKGVGDKLREVARKMGYGMDCICEIGKEERKAKPIES